MLLLGLAPAASGAGIVDLAAGNTRDDLLIFFRIENAFSEAIEKALLSGIPIRFSLAVQLDRHRGWWFDERLVTLNASHSVKYNPLKKEFSIERSWDGDFIQVTQSLAEVRRLMTDVGGLRVAAMDRIEKGQVYRVGVRAELGRSELPPALQQMLLLVPALEFQTEWRSMTFSG
jgi:hypothetical protein